MGITVADESYKVKIISDIEQFAGVSNLGNQKTKVKTPLQKWLDNGDISFTAKDESFGHGQGFAIDKKNNQLVLLKSGDSSGNISLEYFDLKTLHLEKTVTASFKKNGTPVLGSSSLMTIDGNGNVYFVVGPGPLGSNPAANGAPLPNLSDKALMIYKGSEIESKFTINALPISLTGIFDSNKGSGVQSVEYNSKDDSLIIVGNSTWVSLKLGKYLTDNNQLINGDFGYNSKTQAMIVPKRPYNDGSKYNGVISVLTGRNETESVTQLAGNNYVLVTGPSALMTDSVMIQNRNSAYVKHARSDAEIQKNENRDALSSMAAVNFAKTNDINGVYQNAIDYVNQQSSLSFIGKDFASAYVNALTNRRSGIDAYLSAASSVYSDLSSAVDANNIGVDYALQSLGNKADSLMSSALALANSAYQKSKDIDSMATSAAKKKDDLSKMQSASLAKSMLISSLNSHYQEANYTSASVAASESAASVAASKSAASVAASKSAASVAASKSAASKSAASVAASKSAASVAASKSAASVAASKSAASVAASKSAASVAASKSAASVAASKSAASVAASKSAASVAASKNAASVVASKSMVVPVATTIDSTGYKIDHFVTVKNATKKLMANIDNVSTNVEMHSNVGHIERKQANGYSVHSGDTLWAIAERYGITLSQLLVMNPQIKNADLIYPGDVINIPDHDKNVTVIQGDTLWFIAMQNGMSVEEIIRLNPQIKNPDMIYPGDIINL